MLRRSLLGPLLGLLFLTGLGFPAQRTAMAAQSDPATEMLQLVNQFRASQGLPPFFYNGALASAAQQHANWMAANLLYRHSGAGGSTPQTRATAAGYGGFVSENIVGGTNMSPRQGLIWWQNSAIHYNTLVSSRYVEAGIGFATNGEQNMYVLVVGRPPGANEKTLRPGAEDSSAKPLIITPITLAEPREDGSIIHVLQQGQALWTIAAYYDVDLDYLYLINGLTKDDILHPGFEVTVRLADGQAPPPTPTPPLSYVVKQGDSAWSIALQHNISLDYLYLLNNMSPNAVLQPGDELVVRLAEGKPPPPTPTPRTTHTVQAGESIWLVAAIYGLTVEQLLDLNDLTLDSVIRPGDELTIRQPPPTPLPTEIVQTPTPIRSTGQSSDLASIDPTISTPSAPAPLEPKLPGSSATPNPASGPSEGQSNGWSTAALAFVGLALAAGATVMFARRQLR